MNGNLQLFVLFAVAASSAVGAVSGAAPISPQAASNDLVVARRALGDGNWYTAEHRAENAAKLPVLRTEARLVQLETLARSGKTSEIPSRIADPQLAVLAARLMARLEVADRSWEAADKHFAEAASKLPSNSVARVENASEWAEAHLSRGDPKGALDLLRREGAVDAPGAPGDGVRLMAADIAEALGDTKEARALRERLVKAGEKTAEEPYVYAALALSDADWLSGSTNAALAMASNAVARAKKGKLTTRAGFNLGFKEMSVAAAREGGAARIGALVRAHPDDPGAGDALLKLGDVRLMASECEEALKAYDHFLQAYPAHPQTLHALEGRGLAFKELGRDAEAVGAFARAAQMATNSEDRARCQFRQGDAFTARSQALT